MIIKKRHNETNTSQLTQLEEKSNTLFSANSFFAKEMSKARQDKALEKCSTSEKSFLEVMGKGKREIKEFLDELSKEKEEESYQESRNKKLEKLKVHDLRVDEKLFKRFLNDNKGDVKKFLKMKKYDKRPKHMMDSILDDAIYASMSKYVLEQFKCAKSIFNGFIQNNKDIASQLKLESYKAQVSKTLTCFAFSFDKFLKQAGS